MNIKPERDPNGEPHLIAKLNGETVDMTWENTSIFTHAKQYRDIDHIFVHMESEDNNELEASTFGAFIFRFAIPEAFDQLVANMKEADYPLIHKPEPAPMDVEQYEKTKAALGKTALETVIEPPEEIEKQVSEAMRDFEHKAAWYLGEWHE